MARAQSHSQSVLFNPRFLVLETIEQSGDHFLLSVHVEQVPCCPQCGRRSSPRHSSYVRRLQDLPGQGLTVEILLRVRRFGCRNPRCPREVFTERISGIAPYLRQTSRLTEIVRAVGYAAGGLPGARLLGRLAIRISDDTVLRRVKAPVSVEFSASDNSIEILGSMIGLGGKGSATARFWSIWSSVPCGTCWQTARPRASRRGCNNNREFV